VTPIERLAYDVGQAARVAWYFGHKRLAERQVDGAIDFGSVEGPLPSLQAILKDLYGLFERDRANVARGHYRMPHDLLPDPRQAFRVSQRFFRDFDVVQQRRNAGAHQEIFEAGGRGGDSAGAYPRYYLQNFHYQTDGWFSEHSAELYDFQVEVLFNGGADAMRRQALLPLAGFLRDKRIADQPMLDLATGTGRFLTFVKDNYPRLPVTALDLSVPYLDKARRNLARWSWCDFVQAPAEQLPFANDSLALVSCIYLFHELPRKIRHQVAAEVARVLRPGGRLIFIDAFQKGDRPAFEGLLELFPISHHEPYFADYVSHDLTELFGAAGLTHQGSEMAFMSKVAVFDKQPAGAGPNHASELRRS
jgi:ubiquinone/menaquinone biosynthesis C-methylase UbiE